MDRRKTIKTVMQMGLGDETYHLYISYDNENAIVLDSHCQVIAQSNDKDGIEPVNDKLEQLAKEVKDISMDDKFIEFIEPWSAEDFRMDEKYPNLYEIIKTYTNC